MPGGKYVDDIENDGMLYLNAEETLSFVAFWDPYQWKRHRTRRRGLDGIGGNMCAIWAILKSLQEQYPDDSVCKDLTFWKVLDAVSPGYTENTSPQAICEEGFHNEQIARGLDILGGFVLVMCHKPGVKETDKHLDNPPTAWVAERITENVLASGKNLYLDFSGDVQAIIQGREIGHWSAMSRRRA